jgi:hypothetical protein
MACLGLLAVPASVATAQQCPAKGPADGAAQYPASPASYPETSHRYAVQYRLDDGDWTDARVYISEYGATNASPFIGFTTGYLLGFTSMSFVSIPARAGAHVELRVTKLWDTPFQETDHVAVRPAAKRIGAELRDGRVTIETTTGEDFAGDQFVLWWDRDGQQGGGIEGLAFFLDPPYDWPSGAVKTITSAADLADVSGVDTLVFEGFVAFEGDDPGGPGAQAFDVPANIDTIFLEPGAWVQGKFRFLQSGTGHARRVYGPGVLDVSRFNYRYRQCRNAVNDGVQDLRPYRPDGFPSISLPGTSAEPDWLVLDGIIVSDSQFTAIDNLANGVVNNVKLIGWNGDTDGFRLGLGARMSNVFVRTGDDSIEMWDNDITVQNATVWQNANGGVVNLGWGNTHLGQGGRIDGLYVVKMDWMEPPDQPNPDWEYDPSNPLKAQNNSVIDSLMIPGTHFGETHRSVYRNIYIDEAPRVLFSLKILPPDCDLKGIKDSTGCEAIDLSASSVLNLTIENVFTPQPTLYSSIGFQSLPDGSLSGTMDIQLINVWMLLADGTVTAITDDNSEDIGKVKTHGDAVDVDFHADHSQSGDREAREAKPRGFMSF